MYQPLPSDRRTERVKSIGGHAGGTHSGDTLCSPNHPLFAAANPPRTLLTEFSPARGTRKEGKERSRNKSPSQKKVQLVTFCSRCPVGFGAPGSIPCASARLQLQMLEMLRIIHNPAHEVHACPGPEAPGVPRRSTGDTWLLPSPTATWGTWAFYPSRSEGLCSSSGTGTARNVPARPLVSSGTSLLLQNRIQHEATPRSPEGRRDNGGFQTGF